MKKIKKVISIVLCLSFLFNIIPLRVKADDNNIKQAVVTTSTLRFREKATTSSNIYSTLSYGNVVAVLDEVKVSNSGCSKAWYKISYSNKIGYVCSDYAEIMNNKNKNLEAIVVEDKNLRVGPSTSTTSTLIIPSGSKITILSEISNWYYVKYNDKTGWVYSNRVTIVPKEDTDQNFKDNVLSKFPSGYHPYLIKMHNDHPNWSFEAYNTNVDFNTAVTKESAVGVSLTNSKYQGYYSTAGGSYDYTTDKFYVKEGSSWYAANSKVVAYYMDPRNYLNEYNIFAFEKLSYDSKLHTLEAVKATLTNYPNLLVYSSDFITAATMTGVSPIHLASRSAQEIGQTTTAISGTTKFECGNNEYNGGYYNFYNIGAYTSDNPVILGLCTAVNKGWNSPAKAIAGGASTIANGYVKAGQDTIYLERFNVKNGVINTSFQYMTNIAGAMSESSITYSGYSKNKTVDGSFVFKIPIYNNLPSEISVLPSEGNPNNYLKTVTINDKILETFDLDKNTYTVNLPSNAKSVKITGLPVSSKSSVSGTGTIDLTKTKIATLTVKAENGTTRTYTFNFALVNAASTNVQDIINDISVKNDGTYIYGINNKETTDLINEIQSKNASANIVFKDSKGIVKSDKSFKTGDTLTITINNDTKTYKIIYNGDTDGNGAIDILDLLKIQKNIIGSSNLSDEYLKAADVNSDGKVDILDLLKVQKHILGQGIIN